MFHMCSRDLNKIFNNSYHIRLCYSKYMFILLPCTYFMSELHTVSTYFKERMSGYVKCCEVNDS